MYHTCSVCGASITDDDTCPACDRGFCDDCLDSDAHECMEHVDQVDTGSRLPFGWSRRRHGLALLQGFIIAIILFIVSGLAPIGLIMGAVFGPILGYIHIMFADYVYSPTT